MSQIHQPRTNDASENAPLAWKVQSPPRVKFGLTSAELSAALDALSVAANRSSPAPATAQSTLRSAAPALSLTPRERDVLHWLAAGKTDRDIAAILGISPRTVQKHLQRIYDKLGVETRTAAVMRALAALR